MIMMAGKVPIVINAPAGQVGEVATAVCILIYAVGFLACIGVNLYFLYQIWKDKRNERKGK